MPRCEAELTKLREIVNALPLTPDERLTVMFAAIDYGTARADAAIDRMTGTWQRSIDRRYADAAGR